MRHLILSIYVAIIELEDKFMKAVVIFYSLGGNTRQISRLISKYTNADIFEIETVEPYKGSYESIVDQGQKEINTGFMPKIKPLNIDFSKYDTIILGTPVWWYTFAPAMKSFLSSVNLSGKTIYPFATNGGWIGHTFKDFAKICKDALVKEGLNLEFSGKTMVTNKKVLENWLKDIK